MRAALLYWQLAISRVTGKAVMAVALSLAQGLNGVNWSDFTPTQKFVLVVLAIGTGWSIVDAFMDSTMSDLRRGRLTEALVIPGGDTEIIKRNEVAVTVSETVKPGP